MESGAIKPRFCFVAPNCYNLLSNRSDLVHIGGAEVQQVLIATWLANNGYEVSFITADHNQAESETLGLFRVHKIHTADHLPPGLRFFMRWRNLIDAMARANADIYYQRGADQETGQVGLWCKMKHRKFIFSAASEMDCLKELPNLPPLRDKLLVRIGFHLADQLIAQTRVQKQKLELNFSKNSTVIANFVELPARRLEPKKQNYKILWVGRFALEKRFEWLLDLAERCPGFEFRVAGGANQESDYATQLKDRAAQQSNVTLLGHVPHAQMPALYQDSSILCSTSIFEGFANVYLEAWKNGIPVLATYDPDGMIESAGWCRENVDELAELLESVDKDPALWAAASSCTYDHVVNHYTAESVMPGFNSVVQAAIGPAAE